ncbi:MAG: hypothetical protein Q4C34_03230 [Bacteroidales bacterium]|nr:hypothetical protein [Bacteroidales bacterium]
MRMLFYVILCCVVCGCGWSGAETARQLDRADELIAEDPGEALSMLNGMDVSQCRDSAIIARWALLYSEAMVANRLSCPTDTIIGVAIDYYSAHDSGGVLARAMGVRDSMNRLSSRTDELASALYLQKEKEYYLYRERMARERLVWLVALIAVAGAAVIARQRQRMRLKDARYEALIADAAGLRCALECRDADMSRLQSTLHGLLDSRFKLIDNLCGTYYESQGTKTELKAVADRVRAEIAAVSDDSAVFGEMERAVNDCRDGLLDRMRRALPDLSADDYRLAVYLACGLSTRTICLLVGCRVDVLYKRKSRLRARLRAAGDDSFMTIF